MQGDSFDSARDEIGCDQDPRTLIPNTVLSAAVAR
jgi:hypothetical protein